MTSKERQLTTLLASTINAMGFELWGLLYSAHKKNARLVIYIDSPKGVNVEDCAAVSRQISALLDVEDPLSGAYMLEVSSPGIERRLFTLEQATRFIGAHAVVRLHEPFEGQKNFKGIILGAEQEALSLQVQDEVLTFPWEQIEQAQLS